MSRSIKKMNIKDVYQSLVDDYGLTDMELQLQQMVLSNEVFTQNIDAAHAVIDAGNIFSDQRTLIIAFVRASHVIGYAQTPTLIANVSNWNASSNEVILKMKTQLLASLANPDGLNSQQLEQLASVFIYHQRCLHQSQLDWVQKLSGSLLRTIQREAGERAKEVEAAFLEYQTNKENDSAYGSGNDSSAVNTPTERLELRSSQSDPGSGTDDEDDDEFFDAQSSVGDLNDIHVEGGAAYTDPPVMPTEVLIAPQEEAEHERHEGVAEATVEQILDQLRNYQPRHVSNLSFIAAKQNAKAYLLNDPGLDPKDCRLNETFSSKPIADLIGLFKAIHQAQHDPSNSLHYLFKETGLSAFRLFGATGHVKSSQKILHAIKVAIIERYSEDDESIDIDAVKEVLDTQIGRISSVGATHSHRALCDKLTDSGRTKFGW